MASEDFDPKGKGHLLALHILEKGFQAGSIIGGVIVCPILAYRFGIRDPNILIRLAKGMAVSALTGTALAGEHACSIRHLFNEIKIRQPLSHFTGSMQFLEQWGSLF
jgi:hypothetical protein